MTAWGICGKSEQNITLYEMFFGKKADAITRNKPGAGGFNLVYQVGQPASRPLPA
jgi:hypothetical protein